MFHRITLHVMRCLLSIVTVITMAVTPALRVQPVHAALATPDRYLEQLLEEDPAVIQASLTYGSISGQNFIADSTVTMTIIDSEKNTVFDKEVPVDESGGFFIDGLEGFAFEPGLEITVDGGSAGIKELTLQALTLDSADLGTGEVSGTALNGSQVSVIAGNEQGGKQIDAMAGENDIWVVDFTPGGEDDFELLSDMHFDAALTDADGDQTFAQLTSANMDVWLDSNTVSAYDFPVDVVVELAIKAGDETVYYSDSQMPEEFWNNPNLGFVDFRLPEGYSLQPGQKVIIQSGNMVRRTTVQDLSPIAVDLDADTLSGSAAPGAMIWGCLFTESGCIFRDAIAGQDGIFTLDYSTGEDSYDLSPGDEGRVNWSDGQGNNTSRAWHVWQGFIAANVQNRWVNFRDWPQGESVTLKVNEQVVASATVDQNPDNPDDPNDILAMFDDVDFQAGDTLSIHDDGGALIRFLTVGAIDITAIDLANDRVSGTAAEGATVEVFVNTETGCEIRTVQAEGGNWAADFSQANTEQGENIIDLVMGANGWAGVYDEDGDQTMTDWQALEPNITASVQYQWVHSRNWPDGTQVTLKVGDQFVATKTTGPADWNEEDIVVVFEEVTFQAGDTISVSNSDESIIQSLQVANLGITELDSENATITGTTDPNLWLEVCIDTMDGCLTRFVQANGNGEWTADFAVEGSEQGDRGQIDSIAPGSNGWVTANEVDGPNRTWLEWSLPGLPGLQASLPNDWIGGWNFSPLANLEVTVEKQNGEVVYTSDSVTADEGGNFWIDRNLVNLNLLPGMTITAVDPLLGEKTLTLMPLSLDAVDLETDVITGTAPAGSELIVNAGNEFDARDVIVTADDQGVWLADFSAAEFDLLPRMGFAANLEDEDGDRTVAELTNAHIDVYPEENRILGFEWEVGEGNQVTLSVQDSEGQELFTDSKVVQPDDQGRGLGFVDFDVAEQFLLEPGQKVVLSLGNVVRRTIIADLPAPAIDLAASTLTVAYPFSGALINACVDSHDGCIFRDATWDEVSQVYVIDFGSAGDGETPYQLQPSDGGVINFDDGQNNRTSRRWKLWDPNIAASVAGQWVHTREWEPGTQVTLRINGGSPIGPVIVGPAEWNEEDIVGVFQIEEDSIAAGDVLTVTDGDIEKSLTLVDLTVDWSDRADAGLRGSTAGGMLVEVGVNRDDGEGGLLLRRVIADEGTGDWSADFSEPGNLPDEQNTAEAIWDGAYGWVSAIDEDGDRTQLDWSIPNPHMDVWISNNFISVYDWPAGTVLTITVMQGETELYSTTRTLENDGQDLPGSEEFPLAPGQTVTISGGGFERSLTLGDLQPPVVDMANSTLSGTAPEGAFIWACVFVGDDGCVWRGMEVGDDEHYLLDFDEGGPDEAIHVFQPGDRGGINWAGEQGSNTSRLWATGRYTLLAIPAEDRIAGLDWPEGATVNVTVTDTDPTSSKSDTAIVKGADECGEMTCFIWEPDDWTLAPGQEVTATLGTVTKTITISDLQITRVDVLHDQLAGTANANEVVVVSAISQGWVSRTTEADEHGGWMVDFSVPGGPDEKETIDLTLSDSGIAQQVDTQTGDGTLEDWTGESPVVLSQDHIDENVPAGALVGTFAPVYELDGQVLTYSLSEGDGDADNGAFTIDGDALKINAPPNYEDQSDYSIRIRVEDIGAGGKSFETPLAITVNDRNDAPSAIDLSAVTIQEGVDAGSIVGVLSATDEDLPAQAITFSLVDEYGDNDAFTITDGDQLAINQSPDYEIQSSYAIEVRATDPLGGTFDQTFTIEVQNVGEAPTDILLSSASVDENVPANTVIGSLSVLGSGQGQTFTYSLVTGDGDTDNAAFTIDGSSLKINASPNFEVKDAYSVRVRAADCEDDSLAFEKEWTITVNDLNEAPVALSLSATSIDENAPAESIVGTFTATDPDAGQSFAYSLVPGEGDADNPAFTIDGSALILNPSPDYETKSSYSIRVQVSDNGSPLLSFGQSLTVTVQNVEEAPIVMNFSKTGLQDSEIAFSVADFSTHFIDPDSSGLGLLQSVKISALPAHGVLRVDDGPALGVDAEIEADDLNQLVYQPDAGYSGSDGFSWNGSDGVGYAETAAQVALTIGFVADYGLRVSPAGDAKSIKAEATRAVVAAYALTVTNTGNTTDSYQVTLVGTPGWATTFSLAEIANLPVDHQANVTVLVSVPAGASGSRVSTLKIASAADPDVSVTVALTTTASTPPPPAPVLLSVAPASVSAAGLSTAKITLGGANFSEPMTVKIGGAASPAVTRKSSAELVAAVPTSLTPGVYTVQVCNAAPTCASLPNSFTVLGAGPVIGSIYPSQGHNDAPNAIVVRGFNLSAATTLSLPGVGAELQPAGVQVSGGQLQATIPAGLPAGSYNLMACNGSVCDTLEGAYVALGVVMNDFSASSEDLWTAPVTIRAGNTVVLGLNVHRLSGIGLAAAPVAFYVNDPSDPANKISPASDPQTAEMPVGSVDVVTATWTPTGLSGTVTIYAVIDPQHQLTEATRANNTVSTTIQILPREEDETAPVIEALRLNEGAAITAQRQVSLALTANDDPAGIGIKTMKVVERQYNTAARQWVVAEETGWMAYQASYTLTLTEQAGLHFIQVWVSDGAGNVSEMAQASINYAPAQANIYAGQVHIYRVELTAGEAADFSLESLAGDADLYVWDDDGNYVAASLETDSVDAVSFMAAASGTYQVEVYGYTDSTYSLDFQSASPDQLGPAAAQIQSDPELKPVRFQPSIKTQNEPLRSNPSESAPIEAQIEDYNVYLPLVLR